MTLIRDSSNNLIDLAKVTFSTPSITIKNVLPKIDYQWSVKGVFATE
jgi:hypothetical protein